jgi:hypothetical protein
MQADLNTALTLLVGKRLTLFEIDWRVSLMCTDPDAGQSIVLETPFTIGPPGDEQPVIPGDYGPSIARVISLLGETVTSATTEPSIFDLRLTFSTGTRLSVVRLPSPGFVREIEWEYQDGSGPGGLYLIAD